MKYGFVFPGGDVLDAVAFGIEAERAGWDGFFVWDAVWGTDPWVTLTAIAVQTERIRLGTLLTPVSRRRPWTLAGETATLDRLSNGRVILAVGLGAIDTGFENFGEETDRKIRAELMDEGLAILKGLWHGQPFNFEGKHYHIKETTFNVPPPPVQQPRIPVWVVGAWPREKSMRRALQWDGLLPNKINADGSPGQASMDDLRDMKAYIDEHRTADTPFDIVVEGETPGDDANQADAIIRPYAEAGATWWIEARWTAPSLDVVRERLHQGPPRSSEL
jgi:alkanesulfonate monooxygenase SsuD/methylene tetrahydromethanopterin reductase-like flavin-dependent oxidoreductase (luciferase family)